MTWRGWLGFVTFAAEIVLIWQGRLLATGLVGFGVTAVVVAYPVVTGWVTEVRGMWAETVAELRRPPEPEPPPPPFASAPAKAGDSYLCSRCGEPGEIAWDDATARAARHAGVCSRCFGNLLGVLKECQSSEDPTMQVVPLP